MAYRRTTARKHNKMSACSMASPVANSRESGFSTDDTNSASGSCTCKHRRKIPLRKITNEKNERVSKLATKNRMTTNAQMGAEASKQSTRKFRAGSWPRSKMSSVVPETNQQQESFPGANKTWNEQKTFKDDRERTIKKLTWTNSQNKTKDRSSDWKCELPTNDVSEKEGKNQTYINCKVSKKERKNRQEAATTASDSVAEVVIGQGWQSW